MMRDEVKQIIEKSDLILSDNAPVETVEWAEKVIASFNRPAQDDEAIALLDVLSRSDDDCFGLNWDILHFIESSPSWPIWSALNDSRGAWAERLKVGLRNAGIYPQE
jgi:hypothetical protein